MVKDVILFRFELIIELLVLLCFDYGFDYNVDLSCLPPMALPTQQTRCCMKWTEL